MAKLFHPLIPTPLAGDEITAVLKRAEMPIPVYPETDQTAIIEIGLATEVCWSKANFRK